MANQEWINYVRQNKGRYPVESLKEALVRAGASPAEADEAIRAADSPPQAAPSAPPPAPSPTGNVFKTAAAVLSRPRDFFRGMPKSGGYSDPLAFLMAMAASGIAIKLLLTSISGALGFGMLGPGMATAFTLMGAIVGLILTPVFAFIGAGIVHFLWIVLGSKESFETSFRCVAFAAALMPVANLFSAIPSVGLYLGLAVGAYWLYLYVVISGEVHRVSEKAAWALFGVLVLILYGVPFAVRRAAQGVQSSLTSAISTAPGAVPALQGTAQTAQVAQQQMQQMMAGMAGAAKMKPVALDDLKALFPQNVAGMNRLNLNGDSAAIGGFSASNAWASYRGASGARITLRVSDLGAMAPAATMGLTMVQTDHETESGYEKSMTYGSYPGREKYDRNGQNGKITVIVGKRFLVESEGSRLPAETIKGALGQLDLGKLEKLAPTTP